MTPTLWLAVGLAGLFVCFVALAIALRRISRALLETTKLSTRLTGDVIDWSADVRTLHKSLREHNRYVRELGLLTMHHERAVTDLQRQHNSHANWPALSARVALLEMRVMPAIDDMPAMTAANEMVDSLVATGGTADGKEKS